MRWIKAAGAAIVLGALLVGPPWLLVRFIGNPWPTEGISWSAPLTDGAIIGLLAVGVWVLWAQLVVCVVVETVTALTSDRIQLRAPLTLGTQQQLARSLVTAIVVAAVATPVAGGAALAGTAPAASASPQPRTAVSTAGATAAAEDVQQKALPDKQQQTEAEPTTVTVMRLDSLWSIADRVLDSGERWTEIATLNEGRLMNDGTVFRTSESIQPGWQLLVPSSPQPAEVWPEQRHEVERGDTLSGIAAEAVGDATRWPELYEASRGVVGSDPDLIFPGQVITFPAELQAPTQKPQPETGEPADDAETPVPQASEPKKTAPEVMPREAEPAPATGFDAAAATETDDEQGGITVLRALLATAACLAGGALAMVFANRRRQYRERRAGRTIAATPPGLVAVERAVLEAGAGAMETTIFVDRALRHLAASQRVSGRQLPHVGAAVLDETELAVLFTQPESNGAPAGWTATSDGRAWTLPRDTILEEDLLEQPAPYPALVSVGVDAGERTWMLDLEASGVVGVAGPGAAVEGMVRFLVAELALNAWSEGIEVMLAGGFATETVGLDPMRVRCVEEGEATRRATIVARDADESAQNVGKDPLDLRRDASAIDSTGPVVIVVPGKAEDELVDEVRGRARSRVVVLHHDETPAIELTGDGMANLSRWGVTVRAFTLQAAQAADMADLAVATRQLQDEPMPAADESTPVGRFITADGALREDFTQPREVAGDDPSSLLPEADEVYVSAAATTPEDLASLAPGVPVAVREEVEALDPGLDEDLAAWRDPESRRPRVQVLGPVDAASWGQEREKVANVGGTIEFIVFLACQEHGVTPERAAEALGWALGTVHNRARDARKLLGRRADGQEWLPDAPKSVTALQRGIATYELHPEVLVAADLFRRLRLRGQARGANGLEDLVAALALVAGAPFYQLRRGGYGWLVDGDRLDHHLSHAIVDVSHLVVDRALAAGDTSRARWACEIAIGAAPDEDRPRLDLAAVTAAEGSGSADDVVVEQVIDRVDADPTARTEKVLDQRGWLAS